MPTFRFSRVAAPLLVALAATCAGGTSSAAPRSERLDARIQLRERPAVGSPLAKRRSATTPVVIELEHQPSAADVAELEAMGVFFPRSAKGDLLRRGTKLAAELLPGAAARLEASALVRRVRFDGPLVQAPRPLDLTAGLIGADATWRSKLDGVALTGEGVTICDIDNGIDVSHPMFFRADGGAFDWEDVNDNGKLDPGVDTVDYGDGPIVIQMMNGIIWDRYSGDPLFGTEGAEFNPAHDYLYADANGDGLRNYGTEAGFDESTPGYAERTFVIDDVDGNGQLDAGEKLFMLKTSKVKAFRIDTELYRRGENLIEAPYTEDMLHGVGSSGTMVAGQLGYSKLVGIAPGADLVMATDTRGDRQFQMMNYCASEDARVMLHEYAPWVGYHLDGSSDVEQLIDEQNAEGIVHVNPAGNLSTAKKLYKKQLAAGGTNEVEMVVPQTLGAKLLYMSVLWRDTSRDLVFTMRHPNGTAFEMPISPTGFQTEFDEELAIAGFRDDSDRGTALVTAYLYGQLESTEIPAGTWTLDVRDPSAPGGESMTLFAYVLDEVSGWGQGIHFPSDSSEDHLVGWPGTADHGLAVAAFTGHPYDGAESGERAFYSGRGRRIDDEPILWISAPDNPIVPARYDGAELSYMIYGGTSGASPHVAGASALIVQADPTVTGDDVKALMRTSATVDDQTGAVPNEDYGHGKLDVYKAIFDEDRPDGTAPAVDNQTFEVAPGPAEVEIVATDADGGALTLEVDRDYDGVYDETLDGAALLVDYAEEGEQLVKVRVTDETGRTDAALIRFTVKEGAVNDGDGGEDEDDGCGCSIPGDERPSLSPLWALALLPLARRRKRR